MGCGNSTAAAPATSASVSVPNKAHLADDTASASGAASGAGGSSPLEAALQGASSGRLDLSTASGVTAAALAEGLAAVDPERLASVTFLSLKEQRLAEFPAPLLACSALKHLDLNMNALKALPQELGTAFPALEVLDISENELTALPDSVCFLTSLHTLLAFKNKLRTLPDAFGNLAALRELNMYNNVLIKLPPSVATCTAMVDFNVAGNKLKTLPTLAGWNAINRIAAFDNNLVVLPDLSGVAASLEQLQLQDNPLTELPQLGHAPKLTMLDMNTCLLAELDEARLAQLGAVTSLNLKGNKLSALPEGVSALTALEILNVSANQLTELPAGLAQCRALKTVLMTQNQVAAVPPALLSAPALYRVTLKGNPVHATDSPEYDALEAACKQRGGWVR